MEYDKNDAVIADGGNYIKKSGVYFGTITKAVIKESKDTDSWGVEISFTAENEEEMTTTVWVANKDGKFTYTDKKTGKEEKLPGYKLFISIFAVLGIDKIIAQTSQSTGATGYAQLFGKKVGFAIRREEKENTNPDAKNATYWHNNIMQVFNYKTKKSLAETQANKEAKAYLKEWTDKPLDSTVHTSNNTNKSASVIPESDLPF